MSNILSGSELSHVLFLVVEMASKLHISDLAIQYSGSGKWAKVNGLTTDGHYLSVRISIETNTPTARDSGGSQKA